MLYFRKSDHAPDRRAKYGRLTESDDCALMQEVRAGNGDALAVLYDHYQPMVLSIALRILRDRGEAEDILQAIFLEIFQCAAQFDPARGKVNTWIMQYAYHRSINRRDYLSARKFYTCLVMDDLTESQQSVFKLYSEPPHECTRFVHQALLLLDERQRRTIEMVHFEGLSLKDVAAQQNESFSSVRHHYYRGLAKLKQHLKPPSKEGLGGSPSLPRWGVTRAKA
jgi:RNA polymerase sigma-70 factor (ECF subfamily)